MLHDDVYNALQDCDLVLSSTYTTSDAPEHLTAKYHFRRARLRLKVTLYEEALEDYEAFNQLRATGGTSLVRVTDAEKAEVFNAISEALREPLPDEVKLFRAVQVSAIFVCTECIYSYQTLQTRGIRVPEMFRASFPRHPFDKTSGQIMFDEGSITNPPELKVHFLVTAPSLTDPAHRFTAFMSIPERHTLQEYIPAMFPSQHGNAKWIQKTASVLQVHNIQVLLLTRNGRILKVPWEMCVGDIWAGAKWPRGDSDPPALEDLRRTSRARPHEVDGVHLAAGSYIDLFVVRNEEIDSL